MEADERDFEVDPGSLAGPGSQAGRGSDRVSIVRLDHQWLVACLSSELKGGPIARTVQGIPLVLFRPGEGKAAAFVDRCPHRNAPLSAGRVRDGLLECAYHGWRFDGEGNCREVPGLCGEAGRKGRHASFHPVLEQDGFIWVFMAGEHRQGPREAVRASGLPFRFPHLAEGRYTSVHQDLQVEATLHAALENALDVPHTAFLHGGLFRTAKKDTEIEVVVRRYADRAEAEFLGERSPRGLIGRLLAPRGGPVLHWDRFILPSIAQVEYRLGDSHLVLTTAMTPVSDFVTRLYAVATFSLPVPGWIVKTLFRPFAMRIFRQDAAMLSLQSGNIRDFGGEQFASTEIDVLGPHIRLLLKQAERGEPGAERGDAGAERGKGGVRGVPEAKGSGLVLEQRLRMKV